MLFIVHADKSRTDSRCRNVLKKQAHRSAAGVDGKRVEKERRESQRRLNKEIWKCHTEGLALSDSEGGRHTTAADRFQMEAGLSFLFPL